MFDIFAETYFIVRFLRIHPVQSVVNNITEICGGCGGAQGGISAAGGGSRFDSRLARSVRKNSLGGRFGIVLGMVWVLLCAGLGTAWGSFGVRFGTVVGSCWDRFRISLGSSWDRLGHALGEFPSPPRPSLLWADGGSLGAIYDKYGRAGPSNRVPTEYQPSTNRVPT